MNDLKHLFNTPEVVDITNFIAANFLQFMFIVAFAACIEVRRYQTDCKIERRLLAGALIGAALAIIIPMQFNTASWTFVVWMGNAFCTALVGAIVWAAAYGIGCLIKLIRG